MMKTNRSYCYLILVILCILVTPAGAQQIFLQENLDWSKVEDHLSFDEKIIEINKIQDDLIVYLEGLNIVEDNLHCFHFIDLNFDGNAEIVYSGDAGTDSNRTLIFKKNCQTDTFHKFFDRFGEVIYLYQTNSLTYYSIILRELPCCGNKTVVFEIYHPILSTSSMLDYMPADKYVVSDNTTLPEFEFDNPILFEVLNDIYYLRSTPTITKEFEDSNIVAHYTKGSKGWAISERIGEFDRTWWFVIMINDIKPKINTLGEGNNNQNFAFSLGWMSNKYLQKTNESCLK